jgi:hypothetical protein
VFNGGFVSNAASSIGGTTPTLTIGDGGAEDAKILFDGNAVNFHIGNDDSADTLKIGTGTALGTTPRLSISTGTVIINELGVDVDTIIRSNGNDNMLFVDGGNDVVNIGGTTVIGAALTVGKTSVGSNTALRIDYNDDNTAPSSVLELSKEGTIFGRFGGASTTVSGAAATAVVVQSQANLYFDATGNFIFNEVGDDVDFRVESAVDNSSFFVGGSSGHVGVGTSTPDANGFGAGHGILAVASATGSAKTAMLNLIGDGNDTANTRVASLFYNDASATGAGATLAGIEAYRASDGATDPGANLVFSTNSAAGNYSEHMRIQHDGTINISRPTSDLGTAGHTFAADGFVYHVRNGNIVHLNQLGSSGSAIIFMQAGGTKGTIVVDSSSTTYNTSSDYRLKENVDYTWDATTRLKQLKPARFNFIADDTNTLVEGFLAHEAQAVVPKSVTGTKDEVDDDGDAVMQGIDHSKLVPLLVKTIQELEARITTLEA